MQSKNTNYQIGGEVTQNEYDVSLGIWYRGHINFTDLNSVGITLSFNIAGRDNDRDKMRVGVGHDARLATKGIHIRQEVQSLVLSGTTALIKRQMTIPASLK